MEFQTLHSESDIIGPNGLDGTDMTQVDCSLPNGPKWTAVDLMDQRGPKWIEVD